MRKTLLFSTMLLAATSVWAFGGVGIFGHKSHHSSGVNSIGVHVNGEDNKPNIDIRTCDSKTEELVGTECLPKCAEGLERNTDGSCTVCAGENANVYLSYMDDPCGTETPITGDCKSNKDCKTGEFCNLTNTDEDGSKPNAGTCMLVGEMLGPHNVDGLGLVIKSTSKMTWWAAENWCKAQGKNLIDIADFGCYVDGVLVIAEDPNYWDGGDCLAKDGLEMSPVMMGLINAFGKSAPCWTASTAYSDGKEPVWRIAFNADSGWFDGMDYNDRRNVPNGDGGTFALCK